MRLWIITMSYVAGSIAAGMFFPRLEFRYVPHLVHGISVSSAQALLSAAGSGMMALTGITFSLAFLIVQFSGAAYSPRLVSWFARNPMLFHALGIFIATFVYALATLAWVDRDKNGYVPFYSAYLVLCLLVASMFSLVRLVLQVGQLQITNVLRFVGDKGRSVIEATLPLLQAPSTQDVIPRTRLSAPAAEAPSQIVRYRGPPKAVTFIDLNRLTRIAANAAATVSVTCSIGDTLADGMPLFQVYGSKQHLSETALVKTLYLRRERSPEHDPMYVFRILVDIAIKALSPAVNDPTTAVQALDEVEDLLVRVARRQLDTGAGRDARGILRATYPCATWEDYLALAFDEIRVCGASQIQVLRRLRAALDGLQSSMPSGARAEAVRRYARRLDATVESSPLDSADRASARQADRQGIGVTR